MDLVTTVVFCNCTIALLVLVATIWTVQFRKQVVALADWFDRWDGKCGELLSIDRSSAPLTPPLAVSVAQSRSQIRDLRQLYRQQLLTIERLQFLLSIVGVTRAILRRRRRR
jgi:hypothetical protein